MASKVLKTSIVIGGSISSTLRTALGSTKSGLSDIGSAIRNIEGQQRLLGRSIDTFGRMGKNVDSMRARYAELTRQLDRLRAASEKLQRVEKAREANLSKRSELRGRIFETVALGAALVTPSRTAMNFEAAMARAGAVARATDDQLASMTETARHLGATTVWSASQVAEGMQFLSMAGFSVNQTIDAMPGMLNLASAAGADLGRAADIASNILTGFKLEAAEMDRIADVLVSAFTQSNTTIDMLGDTMSYVAPVAAGLGVSLEQTAAMAGKLGDAGIQGSRAGTALRAIMSRLAGPPAQAAKALEELGVNTRDAAGNLRDIPEILAEIHRQTERLGTAERARLFKEIAGEEAYSAMAVLVDQAGTGALQEFIGKMSDAGAAQRVSQRMTDNARGAMIQLSSAIEAVSITIGNTFLPIIKDAGLWLADKIMRLETLAQQFPALTRNVVLGTGALAGLRIAGFAAGYAMTFLRGGVLNILGVLAKLQAGAAMSALRLGGMRTGMLAIGALSGPVVAAIGAIAAGALLLRKYWQPVGAFFSGFLTGVLEAVAPAFERLGAALGPVGAGLRWIARGVAAAWDWFARLLTPVESSTEELARATDIGRAFGNVVGNALGYVVNIASNLADAFVWARARAADFFEWVLPKIQPIIDAFAWIGSKVSGAGSGISTLWNRATRWLGDGDSSRLNSEGVSAPAPPPVPPMAARGGTVTTTQQNTFNITQQPGESGEELAERIARRIRQRDAVARRGSLVDEAA